MDEDQNSGEDRTEEATPERRDEFREKGQVAVSREITSVMVLAMTTLFLSAFVPTAIVNLKQLFIASFRAAEIVRITDQNFFNYFFNVWIIMLSVILPISLASVTAAVATTFAQTRLNWSWKRLAPDFKRLNPLKGIVRMVSASALVELAKGVSKMAAVGLVGFLILKSEWQIVPGLMTYSFSHAWSYWGEITKLLFWSVSGLLVFVGLLDYFYNYTQVEKKLKMTKREVREDLKRREVNPHVKNKIRKLQREYATRKMLEATQEATVVITNPTHYSVALKYEVGMSAPVVVAKGIDYLALRIREVAKENNVEIVENKPLARTLFKLVEIGEQIPESLYRAVSEIIRYIFKLRGTKIPQRTRVEV